MDFFNQTMMIPMKWRVYDNYKIASLETFISEVLPLQAKDLMKYVQRYENPPRRGIPVPLRLTDVIYPVPGSGYREYNPWDYLQDSILSDFMALWKYGAPPSDSQLLGWIKQYGLLTKNITWESAIKFSYFLGCDVSNLYTVFDDFCYHILPESHLMEANKGNFDTSAWGFSGPHMASKDISLGLLKEIHYCATMIDALVSDDQTRLSSMTAAIRNSMSLENAEMEWAKNVSWPKDRKNAWLNLRNVLAARLSGIHNTVRVINLPAPNDMKIGHAFESEEVLDVLWGKMYNLLLSKAPIRRCPFCHIVFTPRTKTQVYCTHSCKNSQNQKDHTDRIAKGKKEEL